MDMEYRQRSLALPADDGLYHFSNEHDACGVGMLANLSGVATHDIVSRGVTILKRLLHRGAAGRDPLSGDGAGLLSVIPHGFFQRCVGGILPAPGAYAVGVLFNGVGEESTLERVLSEEGLRVLAWRDVPSDLSSIGEVARGSCPVIRQVFVASKEGLAGEALERRVFVARRRLEKELLDAYFPSFSTRTIVYKGLMLATQIESFYGDLADEQFVSPLVLVHQRYSTNTFPTWRLAHPFRYLAHNGEINTLRGNLNHARTREAFLESPLFSAEDIRKIRNLHFRAASCCASSFPNTSFR